MAKPDVRIPVGHSPPPKPSSRYRVGKTWPAEASAKSRCPSRHRSQSQRSGSISKWHLPHPLSSRLYRQGKIRQGRENLNHPLGRPPRPRPMNGGGGENPLNLILHPKPRPNPNQPLLIFSPPSSSATPAVTPAPAQPYRGKRKDVRAEAVGAMAWRTIY